jgi:hypothetical protein
MQELDGDMAMVEILYRFFIGHNHKWIERNEVNAGNGEIPECIIVVLRCEVCGKLKNHKIKA